MRTSINDLHEYDKSQKFSLSDLQENGKEKLANLSDDELNELKRQAIEEEDYDIAKLIKQEQSERLARLQEGSEENENIQELEEQTKREEEWKEIQAEKEEFNQGKSSEIKNLIAQLNDGEDLLKSEDFQELDWQAKREEEWKEVNEKTQKDKDSSPEYKENNENKLNDISDKELLLTEQLIYLITEWRYRDNDRRLRRLKCPTEKDIPGLRKYIEEHPEDGITDKASYYTKNLEYITDLINESNKEYNLRGIMSGNPQMLEGIMNLIASMSKNLIESGMKETPQFEKIKKIYNYFQTEKIL